MITKSKKTIIALLLIAAMMCGTLAACSETGGVDLPPSGVSIVIEETDHDIHIINEPMVEGAWAIYNRDYRVDGKEVLTIGSASADKFLNDTVIIVATSTKADETVHKIEKVLSTRGEEKDIEIPAGGFLLCISYSEKDKRTASIIDTDLKERKEIKLKGYETMFASLPVEDERAAFIKENENDVLNPLRRIDLKNSKAIEGDAVIYYESIMSGKIPNFENSVALKLKSSKKVNDYDVVEILNRDANKTDIVLAEDEFAVVFKGEYNSLYAEKHYAAGDSVKMRYLDNLGLFATVPSILLPDNSIIKITDEAFNSSTRPASGYAVYTGAFDGNKVTPSGTNFVDLVIVENLVVNIGSSGESLAIPPNGYVISLCGETAEKASSFKIGDMIVAEKFEIVKYPAIYIKLANKIIEVDRVDGARDTEGILCVYTPSFGETTGTNEWGYEVIVKNNVITEIFAQGVEGGSGDQTIPADGYVISAHMANVSFLEIFASLNVGDRVEYAVVSEVLYNVKSYPVSVINPTNARADDQLVIYTKEGDFTGTRASGLELVVKNNTIVSVERQGNTQVPQGSFVVSMGKDVVLTNKSLFKPGQLVNFNEDLMLISIIVH